MTGALLAAGIAWASILFAILAPVGRVLDARAFRVAGAGTLAIVGLQILGLPLPGYAALAFFAAALTLAVFTSVWARRRGARSRA